MATNQTRPGRTLAILGIVAALLLGLVALGGEWSPRLGLDLQGGTRITLQAATTDSEGITSEKLAQAQEILLATYVGDQVLAHVHGYPMRAVVPSRRGWHWVKWLTEIEVLTLL